MKVTVITGVLNGQSSIGATLASVSSQDYAEIEHIVIDGASTDSTLDIVQGARTPNLRVYSGKDSGVYQAFNRGLQVATGDVIVFLNSGDVYTATSTVSTMIGVLAASGVDAVFGDLAVVDLARSGRMVRRYSSRKFQPSTMSYGFMPAHPTLFIRRGVYDMVGSYDERYRIAGDFEFCLRAFVTHGISYRYVPDLVVSMPIGGLSNRGWRSKWDITLEVRQACRNNGVATSLPRLCLRFPLNLMELT
jgi:glycosyltransferase involved in cell wall biosynthesis